MIPKKYTFRRGRLQHLKIVAAKFLTNVLEEIKENPNEAAKVHTPKGRIKKLTYWKLPHLYGEEHIVSSRPLPLGFQFPGKEPNTTKFVTHNVPKTLLFQMHYISLLKSHLPISEN